MMVSNERLLALVVSFGIAVTLISFTLVSSQLQHEPSVMALDGISMGRAAALEQRVRSFLERSASSDAVLEQRIRQLEAGGVNLSLLLRLEQRIGDLELRRQGTAAREVSLRPNRGDTCVLNALGNFSSRDAMLAAGWVLDLDAAIFNNGVVTAWRDAGGVGILTVVFPVSGRGFLHLRNSHEADRFDNIVTVFLNDEPVLRLVAGQERELCLNVQSGDVLRLTEVYGQIMLFGFEFLCGIPRNSRVGSPTLQLAADLHCVVGQQVWVPNTNAGCCDGQLVPGEVYAVLNETRAIVRLAGSTLPGIDAGTVGRVSQWRAIATESILVDPKKPLSLPARCGSFAFDRERIGIVLIADSHFQAKYAPQVQSQRCYAKARGYDYILLDRMSYSACDQFAGGAQQYFFLKHCLVSQFLEQQPPGYVAVVVDADVAAVALERGVEEWLRIQSDIHLYEREWLIEVMAGNYIARNTPWARSFLMNWARFLFRRPSGFDSFDQGALHMHLAETLQLYGKDKCLHLYEGLTAPETDLSQYLAFVQCVKELLGPPRTWQVGSGGTLTIWPRMQFFVVDAFAVDASVSTYIGPVMLHNVKRREEVTSKYYRNVSRCEVDAVRALKTREELGRHALQYARDHPTMFPQGDTCVQCVERCMASFSCRPLTNDEDPKPRRAML